MIFGELHTTKSLRSPHSPNAGAAAQVKVEVDGRAALPGVPGAPGATEGAESIQAERAWCWPAWEENPTTWCESQGFGK